MIYTLMKLQPAPNLNFLYTHSISALQAGPQKYGVFFSQSSVCPKKESQASHFIAITSREG